MAKIIVYIAVSLDWQIARPDGAVDWLDKYNNVDYGYNDFIEGVDSVMLGYSTYVKSLEFGPDVFKGRKHYVFTKKLGLKNYDTIEFVSGNLKEVVARVKSEATKDIWLMGGGELIKSFLAVDLVEELIIFVMPELIGSGIPLFVSSGTELFFELKETESYKNGVVKLHYVSATK